MKTQTSIIVRTQFRGFHRWPDAPAEVEFLRYRHRHTFHVEARFAVQHDERQLEFFLVQRRIDDIVSRALGPRTEIWSCETWARTIFGELAMGRRGVLSVSVFEDNENGAVIERVTPLKTPKRGDLRGRTALPATRAQRKQRKAPQRARTALGNPKHFARRRD